MWCSLYCTPFPLKYRLFLSDLIMTAAAAFRQTTTVAHSPSVISSDVVHEVWVVTLSFNLWRLFCGLNVFLYVFCRSPSGHPVVQCSLALGRFPLEVCAWRYYGCGCRSSGRSSVRSSRVGSRRSCVYRLPCESGVLAGGDKMKQDAPTATEYRALKV